MTAGEINPEAIGKKLARDLWDSDGKLILPKHTVLNPKYIDYILKANLRNVLIINENDEEVVIGIGTVENLVGDAPDQFHDRPSLFQMRADQVELANTFHTTVDQFKLMMEQISEGRAINPSEVTAAVDYVYNAVSQSNNVLYSLKDLRTQDDYTFEHSVAVSIIAIKIAQIHGFKESDTRNLGIAGLLHDIGKARISPAILQKPGPLSPIELDEIRKHPVYGYRIVQEMHLEDRNIEFAVLEHHERNDGGGYPLHITGDKIHDFAKIIAIADVFDAVTSDRAYRQRLGLLEAVEEMYSRESGYLDGRIAERFIKYILNVAPGDLVVLNTGEIASIVMVYEDEPMRPLVKIDDRFIDLKEDRSYKVMNRA